MNYRFIWLMSIVISCFGLISCGDDCEGCTGIVTDFHYDYLPLELNDTADFRLDSILLSGTPGHYDSKSYLLREEIQSSIPDSQGNERFRVQQYLSDTSGIQYEPSSAYHVFKTETEGIRTFGNLPFRVLSFPVEFNKSWDGTSYFNKDDIVIKIQGEPVLMFFDWGENFNYEQIHQTEEVNDILYDSVLTVMQGNHESLTERRYSIEKYAKKKGLIYKEMLVITEQCNQVDDLCKTELPWIERGDKGFWMRQIRLD